MELMTKNKNLKEFIEKSIELHKANIDFLNGSEVKNFEISHKYFDELVKLQELINSFDFVKNPFNSD